MRERVRKNILCALSAFIGGALITVEVKLNMSEISRAAGAGGGRREGGQSRGGWAGGRAFKS